MSKPIACAAALICYELGHFEMEQPVELYLPEFKGMQVWNAETGELEPCRRRMNIKHLFMHTSGLGGGGGGATHRDKYREIVKAATASVSGSEADDLAESVRRMAALPLAFHPGDMCVCHN
jgi:CubicO group peptidase (beta-lactamase class C family)